MLLIIFVWRSCGEYWEDEDNDDGYWLDYLEAISIGQIYWPAVAAPLHTVTYLGDDDDDDPITKMGTFFFFFFFFARRRKKGTQFGEIGM